MIVCSQCFYRSNGWVEATEHWKFMHGWRVPTPNFYQLLEMVWDIAVATPKIEALIDNADDLEDNFIEHYWDLVYPHDQSVADGGY